MLSRRAIFLTAICAVSFASSFHASAHEAARVETEVKLSPSGNLDVTHVLQLSAAQRLLFKAGVIDKNDMTGLRSRKIIFFADQLSGRASRVPVW